MGYPSVERRRVLAAAALGREAGVPGSGEGEPLRAVTGEILDISPHLIIIETPEGAEERLDHRAVGDRLARRRPGRPGDLPVGSDVSSCERCATAGWWSASGPTSPG